MTMRSQNLLTEILKFYSLFFNLVTKVLLKIREGISCGGTSLKLSLADDDQDSCYAATKYNFNAGEILEWNFEDLGNCSSVNMNLLNPPKAEIIPSNNDTNFCPEYLTVRIDDNLFAASYLTFQTFQLVHQKKRLTGTRCYIF